MIGFHPDVAQQSKQVEFQLKIPAAPDFACIDAFIRLLTGDADAHADGRLSGEPEAGHEVKVRYTGRVLQMVSALQRLGHIPVFSDARVLSLRPQAGEDHVYHVKALIPQLDFFPTSVLKTAVTVAANLVHGVAEKEPSQQWLESAYDVVHRKIIQPFRRLSDAGVSTLPILKAAYDQGTPFRNLGNGTYLLGMAANSHVISRSAVDIDSAIGALISGRKDLTAQILRLAGLPVPDHVLVATQEEARAAAVKIGWPVVVKPADRERSEGVTTGLRDQVAVGDAFSAAQTLSKNILVEQQIPGVCFRLMIANRKFLYAVERRPRSVVGNGSDSLQELLRAEQAANAALPPWFRKKPLSVDDEMLSAIRAQGIDLESIPADGQRIGLRVVESSEWGETTFDVTAQVAPENIELVERAAAALGLHNAGVDMISADISRPWSEVGAAINEVNYRPHFGGTSAARARMKHYVGQVVPCRGRVPVEVYVGDDAALQAALARQRQLIQDGLRAVVTSHQATYGADASPRQFAGTNSLLARCFALLIDKSVDTIILVVQTDEPLSAGFPVDQIARLSIVNHHLADIRKPGQAAAPEAVDQLLKSLAAFVTTETADA